MKVLISGGGIGGFALARLLRDAGHDCLVIERAREFRPLGHFVALKAEGVAMLDRLGVREECEARALPLSGRVRFRTQGGQLLRAEHLAALNAGLGGSFRSGGPISTKCSTGACGTTSTSALGPRSPISARRPGA